MGLSNMDKRTIEQQATLLLAQYGYDTITDDYVDVVNFVQALGFVVGNAALDDNEDGFLAMRPSSFANKDNDLSSDKIIGVNAKRTLEWKRFIIAHEFAHSVLHYKEGQVYLHREHIKGKNCDENDADFFAAALLMPRDSFIRVYNQLTRQGLKSNALYMQLATIFRVPFDSVPRRIDEVFSENSF